MIDAGFQAFQDVNDLNAYLPFWHSCGIFPGDAMYVGKLAFLFTAGGFQAPAMSISGGLFLDTGDRSGRMVRQRTEKPRRSAHSCRPCHNLLRGVSSK